MTKPIIAIHNTETNETFEREMTDEEIKELQARAAKDHEAKAQAAIKAEAKTALLAKLGITEEEAALLLGGN